MRRSSCWLTVVLCGGAWLAGAQSDSLSTRITGAGPAQDTVRAGEDVAPPYPNLRANVLGSAAPTVGRAVHLLPGHRAFFCRFDDRLDAARVPLRFRLGSLDYVNRLEGKPGW